MRRCTTSHSLESSVMRRNFPRRLAPVIFVPCRRSMNCFLVPRRTDRVPVTSTSLILRPLISRSRSWRMVSTSGSSGIGGHLIAFDAALGAHGAVRHLGRRLLGLLLRTAFSLTVRPPVEDDNGREALRV